MDYRNGIDVMTTETTCLSSIWETDGKTEEYFRDHNRAEAYKRLAPAEPAYYDGAVTIDLGKVEPTGTAKRCFQRCARFHQQTRITVFRQAFIDGL